MIIKNKELEKMLKKKGRKYTLTMYVNRFFDMTGKQLDYVLSWIDDKTIAAKKGENNG